MDEVKSREQYVAEGGTHIPEYDPVFMWPYDCAINVFRAMLDEVGLNRTIEATRHYNEALARAVVGMVRERLGQQGSDLETLAMTEYYVHYCTSMGHIRPLEIREGGAICELYACPSPGMKAPPEICVAMSHVMGEAYCRMVNPSYEFVFTHHMGDGDDCCRWVVRKKGSKYTLDDLGDLKKMVPLELPPEERFAFAARMVILSQLFIFTSALMDLVGSERALELVVPLARQTGFRVGTMMKGGADVKGDLSMIKDKMNSISSGLNQSATVVMDRGSDIERTVIDCPLKGAAPEVCRQFEGVFNGICEAISPDYEFAYDRMMSEGHSTCHWVIRKKTREKPKEKANIIVRI